MKSFSKWMLRPFFLISSILLIIGQLLFFNPKILEVSKAPTSLSKEVLLDNNQEVLASGIPINRIPDYHVDRFDFVSTQNSVKQWKLIADKANMYDKEKLVHARKITALLFDDEGKITYVTGKEAKYFMNQKNLEIFGDVVALFPDGFEITSDYMRYLPTQARIEVPESYSVKGQNTERRPPSSSEVSQVTLPSPSPSLLNAEIETKESPQPPTLAPALNEKNDSQNLAFDSQGMTFASKEGIITLPKNSRVRMYSRKKEKQGSNDPSGLPEETIVYSDRCMIFRKIQLAKFTMNKTKPLKERFVKITQPDLYAQSRTADLVYGNFAKSLNYLIARDDVLINEFDPQQEATSVTRYCTGGLAEFDTKTNIITLKKFPQVYQDQDTIVGDVIVVHRDTDQVDIEQSNAFSNGQ